MEAGEERLARDTVRDATRAKVGSPKRENERLKQLVAGLSLRLHLLKKTEAPRSRVGQRHRMSANERAGVLAVVAASPFKQGLGSG